MKKLRIVTHLSSFLTVGILFSLCSGAPAMAANPSHSGHGGPAMPVDPSLSGRSKADYVSHLPRGRVVMLPPRPKVGAGVAAPSTAYLEAAVRADGSSGEGRFTCGVPGGAILLYGHPNPSTSFTTIRIDGTDYPHPFGAEVTAPHDVDSTTNQGVWDIGDIRVTQTLQIVSGDSGNADTLKISYNLANTGTVPHEVGVRVMLDTKLGANDGAPFRVGGDAVTMETEYAGDQVPVYWEAFESLSDPNSVVARGTLLDGINRPDRVVFASWPTIWSTQYDYTVDPTRAVTNDSAVAVYWNPIVLQPADSIDRVTYYGLGSITISPSGDVAVSAPSALTVWGGTYSPNPFQVVTYVVNSGVVPISNISVNLNLPSGLEAMSGLLDTLGDVAPGSSVQKSWDVHATGATTGVLTFSVDVWGDNFPVENVSREITVPALPVTLSVSKVGIGRVLSVVAPGIIDCGLTCYASLGGDAKVTLIATLDPTDPAGKNYTFAGWGGDCSGRGSCRLKMMNADKSVTAFFNPRPVSGK